MNISVTSTLTDLRPAEAARITSMQPEDPGEFQKLAQLGIYLGSIVRVLQADRTHVLIGTGLHEVVLEHRLASRIYVVRVEEAIDFEFV